MDADRALPVLVPGEAFSVSEERRGRDGSLYLKLADGRGWAFEKFQTDVLCFREDGDGVATEDGMGAKEPIGEEEIPEGCELAEEAEGTLVTA